MVSSNNPTSIQLDLDFNQPLFSEQGMATLQALEELADRAMQPAPSTLSVVLIQKQPLFDETEGWLDEIYNRSFLLSLKTRIQRFRRLLQKIRNSKAIWVYVGLNSCHGGHWDLALACRYRGFFGAGVSLGFPDIWAQGFSCGGSLDEEGIKAQASREFWIKKRMIPASLAQNLGIIDCWADSHSPQDLARHWLDSLLSQPKFKAVAEKEPLELLDWPLAKILALEQEWQNSSYSKKAQNSWEYSLSLRRNKKWFDIPGSLEAVLSLIAARFYLGPEYRHHIERTIASRKNSSLGIDQSKKPARDLLFLEASMMLPGYFIEKCVENDRSLCFFHPDPKILSLSLEKVFIAIEAVFDFSKAQSYFDQRLSWYVGFKPLSDAKTICIKDPYLLEISDKDGIRTYHALDQIDARPYFESPSKKPEDADLSFIGAGCFYPKNKALPSLSFWCRFALFDELIRLADFGHTELSKTMSYLKTQGWRYAGQESAWEYFFTQKNDRLALPDVFGYLASSPVHGLSNLRQALKQRQEPKQDRHPITEINLHLGLFMVHLAKCIQTEFAPFTAEFYLANCLGFPQRLGIPSGLCRDFGEERFLLYSQMHWRDCQ